MSGPKSSRYQLTPEQRKALAEARRREIRRKKARLALEKEKEALKATLAPFKAYLEKAALLEEREKNDSGFRAAFSQYEKNVQAVIERLTLPENAEPETLENALKAAKPTLVALKEEEKQLHSHGDALEVALETSIGKSLATNASFADLDEKNALLEKRIAYRRTLLEAERDETLPTPLRGELRRALATLDGECDLNTFEALQLTPLMRSVAAAREDYCQNEAIYTPLRAEYEALCALIAVTPLATDCSKEGILLLERYIKTLSYEIAYDDEESYIGDVLDSVMREMGYHVLADRTVEKKSGKRFTHELYSYRDGTVVNVTTAADGKITMELGKPDRVDRLPSENETDQLVKEMEAFCHDFAEIEEKLRARGVVVADRITMLPPTAEHAQIINVEDYAFRKETLDEKKAAIAFETRVTRRRKIFRHIKTE